MDTQGFGRAWVTLSVALALHVADEAANDFLAVYNPTVRSIRELFPLLPLPEFTFAVWLGGLVAAVIILLALSPAAFRGARWLRLVSWPYGVIMLLNGLGHIGGSIYFGRLMPGVYSAPLLLAASVYLLRTTPAVRSSAAPQSP